MDDLLARLGFKPGDPGSREPATTASGPGGDSGRPAGRTPGRGSRLARRRRILIAVAAGAALLSIGGLIGAAFVKSPAQLAADTAPPADTVTTAKVTSAVLTASVAMRGTVYPSTQYDVSASGTSSQLYISKLDVSAGKTVTNGDLLAEIDGQPMFVLKGSVPAWRTLSPGESGPDVAELQNALSLLGWYDGDDKPGYFGTATGDAVSAFYQYLGYTVPTTGAQTQQAVNQAQKAVTADEQQIARLKAEKQTPQVMAQLSTAESQLSSDESALSAAEAVNGPEVPQSDVVFLPSVPSTVVAVNGAVGQEPGSPFIELSARGALALTGQLPPSYASQVKDGLQVTIYDEATGIHATGMVTAIGNPTSTVPTGTIVNIGGSGSGSGSGGSSSSSGSSGSSGSSNSSGSSSSGSSSSSTLFVPVTVTPSSPLPAALNGENVLVTVQTGQTEGPVLTVPVAAIVTTASGQSFVTVVGPGGKQTKVRVTPGLSDNGDVQVTPVTAGTLAAGDNVVVSG
jgi:multidrug efflux pump subunit AcrA (membrane-fusion protein)